MLVLIHAPKYLREGPFGGQPVLDCVPAVRMPCPRVKYHAAKALSGGDCSSPLAQGIIRHMAGARPLAIENAIQQGIPPAALHPFTLANTTFLT